MSPASIEEIKSAIAKMPVGQPDSPIIVEVIPAGKVGAQLRILEKRALPKGQTAPASYVIAGPSPCRCVDWRNTLDRLLATNAVQSALCRASNTPERTLFPHKMQLPAIGGCVLYIHFHGPHPEHGNLSVSACRNREPECFTRGDYGSPDYRSDDYGEVASGSMPLQARYEFALASVIIAHTRWWKQQQPETEQRRHQPGPKD